VLKSNLLFNKILTYVEYMENEDKICNITFIIIRFYNCFYYLNMTLSSTKLKNC